jgi:hypothetical protein
MPTTAHCRFEVNNMEDHEHEKLREMFRDECRRAGALNYTAICELEAMRHAVELLDAGDVPAAKARLRAAIDTAAAA